MPEVEYVVLADYVRQDAGMTHIMGAGIDTFYVPEGQPVAVPVGIVVRITFSSRDEVGTEHEIGLVFQGPGGEDLLTLGQRFPTPPQAEGVPGHWRPAISIAFRMALPFPRRGDYRLQVTLDDDPTLSRSVDVRAVAPPAVQN
jgi:hypothetical protein